MNVIWSGHVKVVEDGGKKRISYRPDVEGADQDSVPYQTYTPSGFFENKAVNGLVDKLRGK